MLSLSTTHPSVFGSHTQLIAAIPNMRLRIASGVIVAVASLAVSERPALSPKIFGVDPSGAPPLFNPPEFAPALGGNAFDPENVADKTLWDKYLKKGDHMMCLMEATDAGAGWLEKDPRKPPSAASKWTGDLRGEHNLFIISIPGDQHFRQLNSKNGSGTSRSTTRAGNVISRAWDSRRRLKVSVSTRNQSTTTRVIHKQGATTAIQFNIMTNTGLQTLMTNGARRFLSRTRSTEPTVRSIQYVKSICTGRYNSLHRDRILTRHDRPQPASTSSLSTMMEVSLPRTSRAHAMPFLVRCLGVVVPTLESFLQSNSRLTSSGHIGSAITPMSRTSGSMALTMSSIRTQLFW